MSYPSRQPIGGQHGHSSSSSSRRGATIPQPRSPSPYYPHNPNQSIRRTSSPVGWSPPSNAATHGSAHGSAHGSGATYSQGLGGHSPQYNGSYRSDNSTYPSTPRQQGNAAHSVLQNECRAWFFAVDQNNDRSVSSEELRSALLNDGGMRFSESTVKYLMNVFDTDGNGAISYEEFEPLCMYMINWRQMFESFDTDRDGKIDATELARALEHYNLRIGQRVLDKLVKKYGIMPRNRHGYGQPHGQPRPQMELDRFVCASIVVRQMCELYEKCKGGGRSQISRDEFLESVISLP